MISTLPISLGFAFFVSAMMQRIAASDLRRKKADSEADFSLYSSYICFIAAAVVLIAGAFL